MSRASALRLVARIVVIGLAAMSCAHAKDDPIAAAATFRPQLWTTDFTPSWIEVGQSAELEVHATCYNDSGQPVRDRVTLTGLPRVTSWREKAPQVQTVLPGERAPKVHIVTYAQNTPPGNCSANRQIRIAGVGGCGQYKSSVSTSTPLVIAPKIVPPTQKDIWWFGTANTARLKELGWNFDIQLTALPPRQGRYVWKFVWGDEYAEFEGGVSTKVTTTNTVKIRAKPKPTDDPEKVLARNRGNFAVSVTVNGVPSTAVSMYVRRPYDAVNPVAVDSRDDTVLGLNWTYISKITYVLRDQFGKRLPHKTIIREHFTWGNRVQNIPPGSDANWEKTRERGVVSAVAGKLSDGIKGQVNWLPPFAPTVPPATVPCTPARCNDAVHRFPGEVWIGGGEGDSTVAPRGVKVMTLSWVRFTDHARHCDIASPPISTTKKICPCAALLTSPDGQCP